MSKIINGIKTLLAKIKSKKNKEQKIIYNPVCLNNIGVSTQTCEIYYSALYNELKKDEKKSKTFIKLKKIVKKIGDGTTKIELFWKNNYHKKIDVIYGTIKFLDENGNILGEDHAELCNQLNPNSETSFTLTYDKNINQIPKGTKKVKITNLEPLILYY